ncbi:hypothetical protein BW14_06125 [Bifidobacterium sp. UTBIF-68]|nr:hypothetical protein BW14_06125 [Bifidobacterium sp. UTBIF-68]
MDNNTRTQGEAISETLCERCDEPIPADAYAYECPDCASTVCKNCRITCACGRTICRDCATECDHWDCKKWMCRECRHKCVECHVYLCPGHTCKCERCDGGLCDNCRNACDWCGVELCDECGRTCYECGNFECLNHIFECCHCDRWYCQYCYDDHGCSNAAEYRNPYEGRPAKEPFTFGMEIEIDGEHDREGFERHPLIAGWSSDGSLHNRGSREYQTHPMTMQDIDAITRVVETIDTPQGNAGGHMHISRTPRQTAGRWYWALKGLTDQQAENLNMRHTTGSRWCQLEHYQYHGKATAVNDDHLNTIELRTFGAWNQTTAHQLARAVTWMHAMWRFFQRFPKGTLKTRDIMATSRTMYTLTEDHTPMPPAIRLASRKAADAARRIIDDAAHTRQEDTPCA